MIIRIQIPVSMCQYNTLLDTISEKVLFVRHGRNRGGDHNYFQIT